MTEKAVPKCAICGKPQDTRYRPFCSKRCADVDLNRWFMGAYAIPSVEADDDSDATWNGDSGA